MTKPEAFIEGWTAVPSKEAPIYLVGTIMDHPNQHGFKTSVQVTSAILAADFQGGKVETHNTVYRLGHERVWIPGDE